MREDLTRIMMAALFFGTFLFIQIISESRFSIWSFLTGMFFYSLFLLLSSFGDGDKLPKKKKDKVTREEAKLKKEFFLKNKAEAVRATKHLFWVIGLVLITAILCGTLIWVNSHAWVIGFEMDSNTLEAFKSIDWEMIKYGNT